MWWWWTNKAIERYLFFLHQKKDREVIAAFDDLLGFIEEKPSRGILLSRLMQSSHPWEGRAWYAIAGKHLPPDARAVLVNVPGRIDPRGQQVIAVAVHFDGAPVPGYDHTLLWLDAY